MKTQISRDSFDIARRYSGVYLQQGRMIVDADVNELTDIVKARLESALRDAVGSGAPRVGALGVAKSGASFVIEPGRVYADGVPARLDGAVPIALTAQPDYRNPPALPANNFRVYADVWDRPVTALEDNALQDVGLHGADTATRSKTMLQVKWCGAAVDPLDQNDNPQRGNSLLELKLRLITAGADPCDPCAAEVVVDERIGNYLFRVEVHDVFTDAGDAHVVLKWSRDNGAEAYPSSAYPADFDQGAWVWEFFDGDSENLLGRHFPAGQQRRRGEIRTTFDKPAGPLPNAFVRQWDGYAELNLTTGALVEGRDRGVDLSTGLADTAHAYVKIDGGAGTVLINLELLELTLEYGGKAFLAGDYWQVAVREAVDRSGDVVLGGAGAEPPRGIVHHYALLAEVDGGANLVAFTDAFRRQMSFPPLTDLRAGDVGFTNNCGGLYGLAENVQQALDALCNIGAEDIGYTVPACGNAAAPSVRSLLAALAGFPDRDGVPKSPSVKDILDYLMCDLNAARLPYDSGLQAARWTDVNEGGAAPLTVQQALDDLVANLDAGDVPADLPACVDGTGSGSMTLQQLLALPGGSQPVLEWLRRLYCDVRATHIPLDRSKLVCADLATDASVVSVQDALDKLCQNAGNGCEITVRPDNRELDRRLRDFAASEVLDIALCLLPGTHALADGFSVAGKGSIRIKGAGLNATIVDLRQASSFLLGAQQIVFEDVGFMFASGGQMQLNAASVSSTRCVYTRPSAGPVSAPTVRIGTRTQTARVQWQHNVMNDIWFRQRGLFTDFTDLAVVGNVRVTKAFQTLEDTHTFADTASFNAAIDEIADAVVEMPADDRSRWVAVLGARTPDRAAAAPAKAAKKTAAKKTAAKTTKATAAAAPEKAAAGRPTFAVGAATRVSPFVAGVDIAEIAAVRPGTSAPVFVDTSVRVDTAGGRRFTDAIAVAAPTRDAVRDGVLGGLIDVIFDSGLNVALAISSHRCSGALSDNQINGEVLLMNELEVAGDSNRGVDAATNVTSVTAGIELVRSGGGQLTVENNRIDRLWTLVPPPAGGQLTAPISGLAVCTLQGNQLMDINHAVVARKLAVNANHFESLTTIEDVSGALFGRMLVNRATVVGNLSVEAGEVTPTFALSSLAFRATSNFFLVRKF